MKAQRARHAVVLLHDCVAADAPADTQDNLTQVREVEACLQRLGYRVERIAFGRDLDNSVRQLRAIAPRLVFNLVESLDGDGTLVHVAAAVLECLGVRHTGAGTAGHVCSTDKRIAKRLLACAGVPTPRFAETAAEIDAWGERQAGIVKPACEDASVAIDAGSVAIGRCAVQRELRSRQARFGGQWFVEEYIDGREFNVALLWSRDGMQVLPIAEIEFVDFPAERPRIVDYEAKWRAESFAYQNTPRRFAGAQRDGALLDRLRELSLRCHGMFALGGYSRVDFRVDGRGEPFVLEVNANPCLSSDAGFMAAAAQAGIVADEVIARIVNAAGVACPVAANGHRGSRGEPSPRVVRG